MEDHEYLSPLIVVIYLYPTPTVYILLVKSRPLNRARDCFANGSKLIIEHPCFGSGGPGSTFQFCSKDKSG